MPTRMALKRLHTGLMSCWKNVLMLRIARRIEREHACHGAVGGWIQVALVTKDRPLPQAQGLMMERARSSPVQECEWLYLGVGQLVSKLH